MKAIILLPICWFILGCASDRQLAKVERSAPGSEAAGPTLSLQNFVSPEAEAAIQQLHVGMSEPEVFAIMRPVSLTWNYHPVYTEPEAAELYFGFSPTQELLVRLSYGKVASIGPFLPTRPPEHVFQ
jgi:hypothetical protein